MSPVRTVRRLPSEIDFKQFIRGAPDDAKRIVWPVSMLVGSGVGLNRSLHVVHDGPVTKDGNVVPGIVKLVDRARHGGAIVGKGVHFDGKRRHKRAIFVTNGAVSDLGPTMEGACGEVGC